MAMTIKKKQSSGISADKRAQLVALCNGFNKSLKGDGHVFLGKDARPIERINTRLLTLGYLSGGGIPRGRYIEVYGPESSAKSLISTNIMKDFQDAGEVVLVCSREEFDLDWAVRSSGINPQDIIFVDTANGDKGLQVVLEFIESGLIGLAVMDSIQSFQTKREAEGSVENESFGGGGASQMWGRVMRRGYALANQGFNTSYIGISQVRSKIGGFSGGYGPPDPEPTGIMAIRHWKSLSIQSKKGEVFHEKTSSGREVLVARDFKLHVKKNKTGQSDRSGKYRFHFRDHGGFKFGFDYAEDAFRMGRAYDVIENKGAHYYIKGAKVGQGEENVIKAINADSKLLARLRGEVWERIVDDK